MTHETFLPTPPRKPPVSTVGPVAWVRANLFNTPSSTLTTLVFFGLLYTYIPPFVDWAFISANWTGTDRSVCEANPAGACWTFINVRLEQILFGLFFGANPDEVWRPVTGFLLFFGLLIPLMLERTPHKKWIGLTLLVVFPWVFYALIHGEWIGSPVAQTSQWGGFLLTFVLAFVGILLALPLGILLALGRRSEMPIIRTLCVVYIEFWRGTPLITILFMASVMLPLFFPAGVEFDKVVRAMIGITMFQSAYTAEAIRGGLAAIPKGQYEAAAALGLGYWKRTLFIILPQALKISIPGIVNTFIALFKDTSLVSIIGLLDLLNMAQGAARSIEWKGYDIEAYLFAGLIFWMFCYGMSRYSQVIERKLDTNRRDN